MPAMGNLRVLRLSNCDFEYTCLRSDLKNLRWLRMEKCSVTSRVLCDGDILENLLVLQLYHCRMVKQDAVGANNELQKVRESSQKDALPIDGIRLDLSYASSSSFSSPSTKLMISCVL